MIRVYISGMPEKNHRSDEVGWYVARVNYMTFVLGKLVIGRLKFLQ